MATPPNATALAGFTFVAFPRSYWAHLTGPAVYALSRRDPATGRVVLLYVGQCEEMKRHIGPEHDKWDAADAFGMTEILVLRMESKHRRCNLEMLLKQKVRPQLNQQSHTVAAVSARA